MITDTERAELVQLRKRARVNRAVAFRARVVLACADAPDNAVARRLRTTKTTVAKWRHRFVDRRLAGLYDEPRVGAPRTVSDAAIEAVIVKTLETTPPGETHWSTRAMARAAGLSHSTVGRIWRTFRLQPHRTESFKLSSDPQLVPKIRDVVGLYMTPPANAVVFSVDEKSQIQALQRAQPILPMDVGQPERRTHNYVAAWDARSVRGPQCRDRRNPRPVPIATPRAGLRRLSSRDRGQRRCRVRHPCRARQFFRAQSAAGAAVVAAPPPRPLSFHADLRLVAQSGRALLRVADREGAQARIPHQRSPAPGRHPGLRRRTHRAREALHLG